VEYRVRYSASGRDEARQVNSRFDGEPIIDRYLKQTSAIAARWHGWARQLPPPPTPEEAAEAERRRAEAERCRPRGRMTGAHLRRVVLDAALPPQLGL
jgi:hypothetical protein